MGQHVLWRKSYRCPCIDSHTGGADPGCPQCGGRGRSWGDPIASVIGVAGQKVQRQWQQFGVYEDGDVVLTIPSNSDVYAIGEFDRITLTDNSAPFENVLVRGNERIYGEELTIERIFWLDDDKNIVEGSIPTVTDGIPAWSGNPPPVGRQYSIRGRRAPEYYHFRDMDQDRQHHQGVDLPRRVVVRNFDLFSR